jgi:DNA-directed RNA polymerase subunit F
MKRSLIICALIFVVAALLGWREDQQISRKKEINAKLVKEAAEFPKDGFQRPKAAAIPDKRLDRRKEDLAMKKKVKALASDYFSLLRKDGGASAEELATLRENIKSRLEELDPSAIREFMGEFNSIPDVNSGMKSDVNEYVMNVFIKKYPVEMASMMSKAPELFSISTQSMPERVIYDPFKFLVYYYCWMKKDLPLVFECLAQASPEFQSKYISETLEHYADTPLRRAELFEEMRAFASTPEQVELVQGQMSDLLFGRPDAKATFIEVSDLVQSAKLSSDELAAATKDMEKKVRVGETGQWLDWLSRTGIPVEIAKERAFELADRWTEKDYVAVGKWLNSAPDSPEKSSVAGAYAAKTYPYDPENAMKWIETLPQGPDRTKALATIYQGMPKDSDEAEAFASEFGLRR